MPPPYRGPKKKPRSPGAGTSKRCPSCGAPVAVTASVCSMCHAVLIPAVAPRGIQVNRKSAAPPSTRAPWESAPEPAARKEPSTSAPWDPARRPLRDSADMVAGILTQAPHPKTEAPPWAKAAEPPWSNASEDPQVVLGTRESQDDGVLLMEAETIVDLTPHGTVNPALQGAVHRGGRPASEADTEPPTAPESPAQRLVDDLVVSEPESAPVPAPAPAAPAPVLAAPAPAVVPPAALAPPVVVPARSPTAGAPWLSAGPPSLRQAGPPPPGPHPDDAPWTCPRTQQPLVPKTAAGLHMHLNPNTGGLMMERVSYEYMRRHSELWEALDDAVRRWSVQAFQAVDPNAVVYLNCPRCSGPMVRKNFEKVSGVIVDECLAHGVWFDLHELNEILTFLSGSGMRRRARFEANEAAHLADQQAQIRRISARTRAWGSTYDGWDPGDFD